MPYILVVMVFATSNPTTVTSVNSTRFENEAACAHALRDIREHATNTFVMCEPTKEP
jgi:hypothetical protein